MVKDLERLWHKGTSFLGAKYAIMGGAMSWISEHKLVSAISNAGGFGVIACGSMPPEMLKKEIHLARGLTGGNNFGVNIVVMHPEIYDLFDVCIETKVTHVILAGGIPTVDSIKHLKKAGIKVMSFTPAVNIARRLIRNGVDALIIEGMEAGGHIGPVSTSVLAQEILPFFQDSTVPVFVAGGIGHGSMMVNYLQMGASGCQMGTIFVCAKESVAHTDFKKKFVEASSRDTTVSIQVDDNFAVIPVRAISNKSTSKFTDFQRQVVKEYYDEGLSKNEAQLKIEKYWVGALRRAVIDGEVETGSLMAGQSVGMVKKESSVKEIINNFMKQAIDGLLTI
ncbi:MAG: nitronate monooxygenase [Rickettsiaceae bacterium H1]|nr:nitronate monooxygenase [Rickettsiaceae bacterium H1]